MEFIISTENTCDMSSEFVKKSGVSIIKMSYCVNGEEYGGDSKREMKLKTFYQKMREGAKTSTSLVPYERAKEYLLGLTKKGKDVLHVSFASACSGTYDNFKHAADELNATQENKVYVIDSTCESIGQGMLVELICEKARLGASIQECVEYAEEVKQRVNHIFTVDNLKYLAAGGRVTKTAAFVGNVLNIKPILSVDEIGKLTPRCKVVTRKISLVRIADKAKAKFSGEYNKIYIGHSDCEKDAQFIAERIKKSLDVDVVIGEIGPVIGAHSGPGTIAVFFLGANRVFETREAKEDQEETA